MEGAPRTLPLFDIGALVALWASGKRVRCHSQAELQAAMPKKIHAKP